MGLLAAVNHSLVLDGVGEESRLHLVTRVDMADASREGAEAWLGEWLVSKKTTSSDVFYIEYLPTINFDKYALYVRPLRTTGRLSCWNCGRRRPRPGQQLDTNERAGQAH